MALDVGHLALFQGVGAESIEPLLAACETRYLQTGELLLSPHSANRSLFVVLEGELNVILDEDDDSPYVSHGVGGCAGEISVIDQAHPSATVVAARDSRVLVIDNDTLWALIESSHAVARNLLAILADRVRFDNEYIVDSNEILEQHRRNAVTDALTDLNNRRWMEDLFPRKIQRCRIDGEPLCLAVVDLDQFKRFNDDCGHVRGDDVLRKTAAVLRARFRPTDMIARFGGDEFAVLLPNTDLDLAARVVERVCAHVGDALLDAFEKKLTVSAGIAQCRRDDTLNALIEGADAALYRAKDAGRNCVRT